MRFPAFFVIGLVSFHRCQAIIPTRIALFGYEIDFGLLLTGFLFNTDKCIFNNIYSERSNVPDDLVQRSDYTAFTVPSDEIVSFMRIKADGPLALQGIFWVQVPGLLFEVVSFAGTEEGGGVSLGALSDTAPAYRMRQSGDRVWMMSGLPDPILNTAIPGDVTLDWLLLEGSAVDPRKFKVVLDVALPFFCYRYQSNDCPLLSWNMTLAHTPTDGDEWPSHEYYESSVVWDRDSSGFLNFFYETVQIVNGAGDRLEPAYSDFIQAVNDDSGAALGYALHPDPGPARCPANAPWWCPWC